MAYTTIKKPSDYFNTKLYTGNGGTNAITGVGFQPDFVWLKSRSEASTDHKLLDAVRGVPNFISSNLTAAEASTGSFNSIDSDGFTVDTTNAAYNQSSATYATWNWKANGSGSSNTDGSITSTVSANTTAGFSIITYTGTGSAGTIGHGLGVVPDFWMVKARSETRAWYGWHKSMSYGDVYNFNSNGAKSTDTSLFTSNAPTTSVINLGTSVGTNNNGITFVCYAFSSKTGYSKFGSYTGNGNDDGTFVYTGFKPAWIMIKRTDNISEWNIYDVKRNPHNLTNLELEANTSDVESNVGEREIDILSNGFKIRGTSTFTNTSGATYSYMAFAEEPLVGDNPATAR